MTKVYGASDDLIEFEGDIRGEVNFFGSDDEEGKSSCLLICSDGTLLEARYGKAGAGIWRVSLVKGGTLFENVVECTDEDAEPSSDVAHFKDGLKWAYAAHEWEKVH